MSARDIHFYKIDKQQMNARVTATGTYTVSKGWGVTDFL